MSTARIPRLRVKSFHSYLILSNGGQCHAGSVMRFRSSNNIIVIPSHKNCESITFMLSQLASVFFFYLYLFVCIHPVQKHSARVFPGVHVTSLQQS
jgi:hypothetical protein